MIKSKEKVNKKRYKQGALLAGTLIVAVVVLVYFLRPVNIASVVREYNDGYFFVDNFPMTDKARIEWWQDNKDMLKEKYNMPFIGSDKQWMVLIGEAGEGFKFLENRASDNDLLCFDSLKPGANCAEKKWLLWISHYNKTDTSYNTDSGLYVQLGENAELKRVKH